MRRTDTSGWPCNIARSAHVLADLWNVLLIREACFGTRRFEAFQRRLGIGRNILSIRLNLLVDEGILERVEYQTSPSRHEYRLTEKGRDAYKVLAAMDAWGRRWLAGDDGSPVLLHHDTCGRDFHAEVVCSACHEPIEVRDVKARPGPGTGSAPPAT